MNADRIHSDLAAARKLKEVAEARRGIQYAADSAWPALEEVHGPIRKFKIPLDRRLV